MKQLLRLGSDLRGVCPQHHRQHGLHVDRTEIRVAMTLLQPSLRKTLYVDGALAVRESVDRPPAGRDTKPVPICVGTKRGKERFIAQELTSLAVWPLSVDQSGVSHGRKRRYGAIHRTIGFAHESHCYIVHSHLGIFFALGTLVLTCERRSICLPA
jgi:hypothetical protein